ncbi:peptidylprolyl isomerase [Caulobacter endophyticus]|uniref:peptidylprolyl isomerase n=1 Tax=Caulobacter endophyticus TaxID=2172652 RepID=UPI00240FFCC3|nr:peptidylprolyl isomerase [Caulobacter endophyticus]MDG2529763.1 peptidylprolyl isomerase [Caulobacter endophyticus]
MRLPIVSAVVLLTAAAVVPAAQAAPKAKRAKAAVATAPADPRESDWRTPAPDTVMVIDSTKGRILVELIPEVAPAHVARLQELTREGVYDRRTFFRVIDRFMAQTGDPEDTGQGASSKPNLKAEFTFRRDQALPFVVAASPAGTEVGFLKSLPVVSQALSWNTMTSDKKVAAWGTYCPGVLGMARDDAPDSANSQFFLMRQPYPSLDKRYTAFGRVISGLEVVRDIKTGEPVPDPQDEMTKVRLLSDIPAAERPKVRVIDPNSPWFRGQIAAVRRAKGADFSVCDLDLPVSVQ